MKNIILSISLGILCIFGFGTLKYSFFDHHATVSQIDYDRFWLNKTYCDPEFDVVLIGDSRVNNGLSPLHMEKLLTGMKVVNLGYNGLILEKEIIALAESKISPLSKQPIIIIGVSPGSFLETNDRNGLFKEFVAKGETEHLIINLFGPAMKWLSAVTKSITFDDFSKRHGLEGRLIKEYTNTGWMSIEAENVSEDEVLKIVKDEIHQNKREQFISEELFNETIGVTSMLIKKGFKIFVIRMPQHPLYEQFENNINNFNESHVRSQFEIAGAIWLDIDKSLYKTYDGVHLKKSSAERLSHEISVLILPYTHSSQLKLL